MQNTFGMSVYGCIQMATIIGKCQTSNLEFPKNMILSIYFMLHLLNMAEHDKITLYIPSQCVSVADIQLRELYNYHFRQAKLISSDVKVLNMIFYYIFTISRMILECFDLLERIFNIFYCLIGFWPGINTILVFYHQREPHNAIVLLGFSYYTQVRPNGTFRCQF